MAKKRAARKKSGASARRYCTIPEVPRRTFPPDVSTGRARAILVSDKKWVNGTTLRYYFFKSPAKWNTTQQKREVVREAFKAWKAVGIGLEFKEVDSPDDAEIRIGFESGDGHWSYLGRGVLDYGASERTLNLDKSDAWDIDTAIHEIGHSIGLPHEHQNPKAGIVWDEEAVYQAFAEWPNFWDRSTTYYNIIRKIRPDDVQGSTWDPDSIMHYTFEAGLIKEPEEYKNGISPAPGLSARDKEWVKKFYPPLEEQTDQKLEPFRSVRLHLEPAEQANFTVHPEATRNYTIRTFGESDTVLVLFEEVNGELRYRTADDDSGQDYNANIRVKLYAGRKYVLRVRLYYRFRAGDFSVMMW